MIAFHTRAFVYEGETVARLPADSGFSAGDKVLLFMIGRECHVVPAGAGDDVIEPLRRRASIIAPSDIIALEEGDAPAQ